MANDNFLIEEGGGRLGAGGGGTTNPSAASGRGHQAPKLAFDKGRLPHVTSVAAREGRPYFMKIMLPSSD